MVPFSFSPTGGAGGSASSGIFQNGAQTYGPGMGDWTVSVGGSGANSGQATSTAAAPSLLGSLTGNANTRLVLIGILIVAALWINKQ